MAEALFEALKTPTMWEFMDGPKSWPEVLLAKKPKSELIVTRIYAGADAAMSVFQRHEFASRAGESDMGLH